MNINAVKIFFFKILPPFFTQLPASAATLHYEPVLRNCSIIFINTVVSYHIIPLFSKNPKRNFQNQSHNVPAKTQILENRIGQRFLKLHNVFALCSCTTAIILSEGKRLSQRKLLNKLETEDNHNGLSSAFELMFSYPIE